MSSKVLLKKQVVVKREHYATKLKRQVSDLKALNTVLIARLKSLGDDVVIDVGNPSSSGFPMDDPSGEPPSDDNDDEPEVIIRVWFGEQFHDFIIEDFEDDFDYQETPVQNIKLMSEGHFKVLTENIVFNVKNSGVLMKDGEILWAYLETEDDEMLEIEMTADEKQLEGKISSSLRTLAHETPSSFHRFGTDPNVKFASFWQDGSTSL